MMTSNLQQTGPGKAEAELALLNKLGIIDIIITDDSDALVFGATCVMCK